MQVWATKCVGMGSYVCRYGQLSVQVWAAKGAGMGS